MGRAAPTVAARKQVLREALHLAPNADLRPTETEPDPLGFVHEQYQLYYQGVKVEHGLLRVHSRAGKVESVSGETLQPAAGLSVQPGLSEAAALQRAMNAVGARSYMWQLPAEEAALKQQTGKPNASYQPHGELVLVGDFRQPEASRQLVLAWKFNIYAHEPVSRAWFYIDAQTGQVVLRNAIIKHANAPGATFATRYVGARTSITDNTGSSYRLRETATSRGVTTLNVRKGNTFSAAIDFVDNDNNWTAAEHNNANFDNAALDAHLGAQATQGYWSSIHGRDSYDDQGSVLLSYVHYDDNTNNTTGTDNAYWNGTAMLYGDGNTLFRPLTAIDVCGHEIGHAVCDATADLVYSYESGAMNEGFSDIWGACVENYFDPAKQIWLIGEDITLPSFGPALRSMSNPNAHNQPDTYKGTRWYTGTGDNGGVHTNSGVLNYWFYLLSDGGSGTNDKGTTFSVTGISIAKAERIAYRAERFYLTTTSQYINARQATIQSAIDLFGLGSAEATATAQAWRAVGVGTTTGALEAAPTISSFAATSGPVGTVVTITGANLGATYQVTFNGTDARIATLSAGTTVTVPVPAGATTGVISLTTPSGTVSTGTNFTVSSPGPAPTITSYLPATGQVQGGSITITGTNFTAASTVSFNGTAATSVTFNSATQLTVTVPAGATSGPLTVTSPNGTATAPTAFTVLPAITSFTPVGGGAVGTAVTITGTSFTGAVNVKFNGVYATPFTVINATTITTTVPNGAATGPLTVRTPSGTATAPTSFIVAPSLAFDSFSPSAGIVGTVVNIRGRGFTGTSAITFGGVSAPTFTVASDLEIWATVPTGAQTGSIVLTTPLGTATSPTVFTVDPGYPIISGFTPMSGPVGTAVTITGSYFTGSTAVRFNGTPATFSVVSSTTINTTVPAGATTGPISVTNAVGTGTSAASFNLPPVNDLCANALPLTCGGTVTGTTVGITNTGDPTSSCGGRTPSTSGGVFYQLTGTGGPITLSACTGTTYDMVLFVYTGSCGSYTCVGSDDDGCGNANGGPSTLTFTSVASTNYLVYVTGYNTAQGPFTLTATCGAPPTISSFTPTSGPVGTSVTITGTGFSGITAVRFNGTAAATFSVTNATTISATVPAGATTGPISVVNAVGTGTGTSFTVLPPAPTLTGFNPTSGVAGTPVNLTGTGLSGATSLSVNGVAVVPTGVTATSLSFVVPAGGSATQSITVTAPGGTSAASTAFTVLLRSDATGTLPAANAVAAARPNSAVTIGFTEPVTGASMAAARVFSAQIGGRKAGAWTTSGSTASFASTLAATLRDFRAGELVNVTMPGSVLGAGGLTVPKRVYQFTTATGGTGRGYFGGGSDLTGGNFVTSVALGDVTADGRPDLLWSNYGTNTVSVAPALSAGGFDAASAVTVGNNPINMALADFNGDGTLDFVTVNYGIPSGTGTTLSLGLNGGTGTFTVSTLTTGTGPRGIAVGDLDGDGDLDLAVPVGSGVEVYANNGSGTFSLASTIAGINFATNNATGDVDNDGDLDLLTANYNGGNTVSLRLNSGNGTFTAPATTPEILVGTQPYNLSVADLDDDGDLDLLTSGSNGISVRFNNGGGVFSAPSSNGEVALSAGAANVAVGDVDSDGDLDFIAGGAVRLNNGLGVFSTPAANATVPGVYNFVALADLDNDGDLDVAGASGTNSSTGTSASVRMNEAATPLPVELVAFSAAAKGANVQLDWRTASEKNSARFEVERSLDGRQFARIGEVAAQGTKASPTDYTYLDTLVPKVPSVQAPIYYRLRQVDVDGTASYSPARAVTLDGKSVLALFPNPTAGAAILTGAGPGTVVHVFDVLGREVLAATADAAGTATLVLPHGVATGVYVVRSGAATLRLTLE